jgi:hypothetical protein
MDVLEHEREHLAEADCHIAVAKQQVEQQKRVIEKLVQDGHDTRITTSLLDAMESGASTHSSTIAK